MPLHSMTGFARIAGRLDNVQWAWEVRSLNGRGLDLRTRLPQGLEALEPKVKAVAQDWLKRGNLQVSLTLQRDAAESRIRINRTALNQILAAMDELSEEIDADPPRLDGLLALRGVIETAEGPATDEAEEALAARLSEDLPRLFKSLAEARAAEGAKLHAVLARAFDEIERLTTAAAALAENQPAAIQKRLGDQLRTLLDGAQGLSPERLAQEVALLAAKADAREETDRLHAHVAQARSLLEAQEPSGRKLDFLTQEFMREANTLCSKASDLALTRLGLDLKTIIDQVREQVQNVE